MGVDLLTQHWDVHVQKLTFRISDMHFAQIESRFGQYIEFTVEDTAQHGRVVLFSFMGVWPRKSKTEVINLPPAELEMISALTHTLGLMRDGMPLMVIK